MQGLKNLEVAAFGLRRPPRKAHLKTETRERDTKPGISPLGMLLEVPALCSAWKALKPRVCRQLPGVPAILLSILSALLHPAHSQLKAVLPTL